VGRRGNRKGWRKGGEKDGESGGRKEGREREGMEQGRRKVTEGMGGTGEDMVWDGKEGKRGRGGKRRRGAPTLNFNSWRRHC